MRRALALIALAGLAAAASAPLAAAGRSGTGQMACCQGGATMACCIPTAAGEMKSCPGGERDPVLPGLAPAILGSPSHTLGLDLCGERVPPLLVAAAALAPVPPEQPPRG